LREEKLARIFHESLAATTDMAVLLSGLELDYLLSYEQSSIMALVKNPGPSKIPLRGEGDRRF
jgi:hypothetical protein